MRHTQREAETQAEGEAGSMLGARCGSRSQDPGSHPGLKAGAKPLSHRGVLPFIDIINGTILPFVNYLWNMKKATAFFGLSS